MHKGLEIGDVLVMGSNGLLGSAIINLLLQGYGSPTSITGFDIGDNIHPGIGFVKGDIRDADAVREAVSGKTVVINTVAVVNFNPKNNAWMHSINVDGAMNVLEACASDGNCRLIHTSTMDVSYGGKPIRGGDETLPYPGRYMDHYSLTKRIAEERLLEAETDVPFSILRATGIYGPNDHIRFPAIMKAVLEGKYPVIGGRGSTYSHVFAYNCGYAHILAAGKLAAGNSLDRNIYFIVDESTMNFHDFVDRMLDAAGLERPTKKLPKGLAYMIAVLSEAWMHMPWTPKSASPMITRLGVSMITTDVWFKGDKAERDLGYTPLFSLEESLKMTSDWIRETYLDGNSAA